MKIDISTSTTIHRKITPLSIKLEEQEKSGLEKIAKEKKRSVHFLLRQAVTEYLEREQKRLDFYEEAKRSSEHFKKTGLHVTLDEVQVWAESLGTPNELPPPQCHK